MPNRKPRIQSKFAQFVHARMDDLNITQEQLAERIGIPDSTLSRYIHGDPNDLKAIVIVKIADGLVVPFSQLMALAGYPIDGATIQRDPVARLADLAAAFPWIAPLTENLSDLAPDEREAVLAYIELLQRRRGTDGNR